MSNRVLLLSLDGQSTDAIVQPLQRLGIEVSVTNDLGDALSRLADHQLVILDARDGPTLAMTCRRINDEAGSRHPPILAGAHSDDVEARVRLLEAGADDVFSQPVDERELEALVEALLLRGGRPAAQTSGSGVGADHPMPTGPGRVIAFGAAKGGAGTTTLAVNTALVLAEMAPGSVAIADLDMYHGQVSTHLDIYARNSTAQMAHDEISGQSPELIHEAGKQHASGLTVFGGPYRPDEGTDLTGDQLAGLVDALRQVYATLWLTSARRSTCARSACWRMPITSSCPSPLISLHCACFTLRSRSCQRRVP